jgi:hypothetical protein
MKDFRSAFPYLVPFFVFILIGSFACSLKEYAYFLYPAKTVVTAGLLVYWWKRYTEIRLSFSLVALLAGFLVFLLWIGLTEYLPFKTFHPPPGGYNPVKDDPSLTAFLMAFRLGGAVLVVPVFEELFIRSFVIRYLVNSDDFRAVPAGTFTWFSFAGSVIIFCGGHQMWEWPAAFAAGIIYNLILYRRKNLFDCIIAHATTNLLLGIYVLTTGKWGYW